MILRRWGIIAIASALLLLVMGQSSAALALSEDPGTPIRLLANGDAAKVSQMGDKNGGLTLQLQVPVVQAGRTELGGQDFDDLEIPGSQLYGEVGQPALPLISQLVAVPSGMTLELSDLTSEKTRLEGTFVPAPAQGVRAQNDLAIAWDRTYYNGGAPANKRDMGEVQVGEPGLIRGQRVVSVTFRPLSWDPATGIIEAAGLMTASFNFVPSQDGNNPVGAPRAIPESFASLYNETVLGYEKAAGQESTLGTWLVIYPNLSGVGTAMTPLIDWRERQGYNVVVATTAVTGTTSTSIKNYIQNQYDTLEIPLEFVTLVGDATGAIPLASWRENLSGYNGEGDHEYSCLEGGDILADIHIGRLSVISLEELNTVVNKIVSYESNPFMASDPGWFARAGLTGDPGSSGYSCIWVNQWVKQQLQGLNYTQIDTIWGGNFVTQMMATINQGESIFTYRGYWQMSGMSEGYIASLSNGAKLPFALILTCDTGSFWSDTVCRSEAFLRAPNGGGVASIGTATTGTHTRYNNCMFQGVAENVLNSGDPRVGPALTRGKLSMYENYIAAEPAKVTIWSTWNNLMGDPATPIWSAVPADLVVDYPANLSIGANALPVTVTSGGQPVAGARVALFLKDRVQINGLTDDSGYILFPLENLNSGNLMVTVTGRNLRPHLGGVNVGNLAVAVDYQGQILIDDGTGGTNGNGDGVAAPGETVGVSVQLVNNGTGGAGGITATVSGVDGQVSVLQGSTTFAYMGIGGSGWGEQDLLLAIDSAVPGGSEIPLELTITSDATTWKAVLPVLVNGPAAAFNDAALAGGVGGNGQLDPGETGTLSVGLNNIGNLGTSGITAVLTSQSQWVTVVDADGMYPAISAQGSGSNTTDLFSISAASDCYPGHLASFTLDLVFAEGGTAQVEFQLPVGTAISTDPVGPDRYGYLAFDNTDTAYDLAPVYDWVEIDPALGGAGTSVGLTDFGNYQDDTKPVNLPFSFSYYGSDFDVVSVCSNGWVSMGRTYLRHYRNWTIPSPGGPDNMIAVCWDDHYLQSGTGGVFSWYDVVNHRFIIEWSQVGNTVGGAATTFQVMLYDPAFGAGDSGDGIIVTQYKALSFVDSTDGYFTVGIQNEARDDGVLYTYYNRYPGGAAPMVTGRAITFRTVEAQVQGVLMGAVTNASGGGTPVDGASVTVLNSGRSFMSSAAGLYQGGVPIGLYDVAVNHPGFAADTTYGVQILEATETVVDFQLLDIAGPDFTLTQMPTNTEDTAGPYTVGVDIHDYTGLAEAHFYYTSSTSGGPFEAALVAGNGDSFSADIPGQVEGSRVQYWMTGLDTQGNTAAEPAGAPFSVHTFVVTGVSEIYATDMETDGGWTSGVAGDTANTGLWERVDPNGVFNGTVEIQPEDDHTPVGTMCWITGNDPAGSTQGANDVDGGLTTLQSPTFDVSGMSSLQVNYYRWYTNDTGNSPGADYWRVQVSNGDGNWVNMEETLASDRSWLLRTFTVGDFIAFSDQLTFRFLADDAGSGSIVEAGVDDFSLIGYNLPGDGAAPEVSLTSFGGGQSVVGGTEEAITWIHSDDIGVVQVEIRLSTDSGTSWDHLVATGPLNGAYTWEVPALQSETCRLKVICRDAAGNATEAVSGADFTISSGAVAVGDIPNSHLALAQNAPNPFNPRTEIKFSLPSRQAVSLKVYNVEGRLVRNLLTEAKDAGVHTVVWSGEDDRGGRVASGLYFYRLTTDSGVLTRKMTLLK